MSAEPVDARSIEPDEVADDGYVSAISSEKAFATAKENGWEVVLPAENELLLDIDNTHDFETYERNIELFSDRVVFVTGRKVAPSKSGKPGKCHVTLTLAEDISHERRILFQLMLGSDRKRELLSHIRVMNNDPSPTLFFEKASK